MHNENNLNNKAPIEIRALWYATSYMRRLDLKKMLEEFVAGDTHFWKTSYLINYYMSERAQSII